MKKRLAISLVLFLISFLALDPLSSGYRDHVFAQDIGLSTYTKTFTISAYYSPLPCQSRYATGSYEGDIRLNGNGTNGADGTEVYPGMIAAPKTYAFGTKMDIAGIGLVAVHDRGGAIKPSNGQEGVYDRLDIWMGFGDKGLTRALNWGKRTMNVVVYGVNPSIQEQIALGDYDSSERYPGDCVVPETEYVPDPIPTSVSVVDSSVVAPAVNTSGLASDLKHGASGDAVRELQAELAKLNLFRGDLTGYYGDVTEHAVFKFQQGQGLIYDETSLGAGIFGPKTRDRMNEIVVAREYTSVLIAEATSDYQNTFIVDAGILEFSDKEEVILLFAELQIGSVGPEVELLQTFLKEQGYFDGALVTNYFGPITQRAVLAFQLANDIVDTENDTGAGRVGPATLNLVNALS